ncbi:MAG: hypothetical protein GTO03_09635, partial [Planctomycetales bacterium]|nr:hypothetical protein [Planctomycetales bacterium]
MMRPSGSSLPPAPPPPLSDPAAMVRAVVQIEGHVQGVGFRPFLYRLATSYGLRGTVGNSARGVDLEVEGPRQAVKAFLAEIPRRAPAVANVTACRHDLRRPAGYPAFVIRPSAAEGHRTALISPDLAVCRDCLGEMFDPRDRRFRYPLINCTNCGPRYTIIADVPYDRAATTMSRFTMCPACQAEYDDPANRRFHAQPNACPTCGPRVWLIAGPQDDPRGDPAGPLSVEHLPGDPAVVERGHGGGGEDPIEAAAR